MGERTPSDGELVARVLAGDVERFGQLVERCRVRFARYATALCGDPDVAADAMQEAFIRAFTSLKSCRDPENFQGWFFRILTNQCHNYRSRSHRQVSLDTVELSAPSGAEEPLRMSELRRAIATALDALTPEQREAFVLKHIDGRSYAEMAELLRVNEDALKMRVYRAREVLRRHLESWQ